MHLRSLFPAVWGILLLSAIAAAQPRQGGFSGYGLIPREETGADRFLHAHPESDGRGVVVAIFDTGVDPGAPGLQVTSDGRPKILDLIDGTGSGDVDTSKVVTAEDGRLTGLSGRTLKLGSDWRNPTGQYHLGFKRAYELYPDELVERLVQKRREKWDAQQRAAVTALTRELAELDAAHPDPNDTVQKLRAELTTRLEQLNDLQEKYDDPGPLFDCVVFHDGESWRVAIDTNENGDLGDEKLLADYAREHQYATFGSEDLLNFAVHVYADGNLLSIVADSGSHGTHVAGIVAAYLPGEPDLCGLAPGAQLVSVKIGDTRLGSSSSGTGEARGCIAVLDHKCDLINMSFGGASPSPDRGRIPELYSELVNKHGIIFVSSAGNEGPALSTAGSPGATTGALFGVGAYLSPDMMSAQYSMRERAPAAEYTWSSRGPTLDGDLGVKFSAPGGAISPVPNWVLARNQQMHGTSMASPNACGNIALLLSALKAEHRAYSPRSVRRALENTAAEIPNVEVFAQGRGLIQIDKAYEYLHRFTGHVDEDLRFDVRIPARDNARGVYLREPFETDRPCEARVTVSPLFHEDADNREKVDFELRCNLESTARWIECADQLVLMHGGRRLDIRVDPTRLPPGAHYAEIRGYDSTSPERGPLFRVPITVIRPEQIEIGGERDWHETLKLETGKLQRRFFAVPSGATWADLRVRRLDDDEPRTIVLHTVQLVPGCAYNEWELQAYLTLSAQAEEVRSFKVAPGRTLEVCLAQSWSSLGGAELEWELTFHGLQPDSTAVALEGSAVATPLRVAAPLRRARLAPRATLDTLRQTIRPAQFELRPLDGQRDRLPDERQIYELVLTYNFKLADDARVTPRVAMTNLDELNDSFQSQMYMLFDSAKRLIHSDADDPKPVQLDKGDYVLRFHLRYADREQLKRLKSEPLLLDRTLDSPVALAFYPDPLTAISGVGAFAPRTLEAGDTAALWLVGPPAEKLPKGAQPGDVLLGTLALGASESKLGGAGDRPGGYRLTYVVPPKPVEKDKTADPGTAGMSEPNKPTPAQRLAEAVRDLKVARLAELHDEANAALFDQVAAEVLAEYPNFLPVLVEQLMRADGQDRDKNLPVVVAAADRVIAQIDTAKLAAHYGVKLDPDDEAAAKVRAELDRQKAALTEALSRKARALLDQALQARPTTARADITTKPADEPFEQAFAELAKWVDTTADDYLLLHIDRERYYGRLGEALKLLNKKLADVKPDKKLYTKRAALLGELGWTHWQQYDEKWLLLRFPATYPPF